MTVRLRHPGLLAIPLAGLVLVGGCSVGDAASEASAAGGATDAAGQPVGETSDPGAAGATEEHPGVVTDDDAPVATDGPRPEETQVVLSYLYWDPATAAVLGSGYVSPVIEDGGTCTLRLRRDGASASATSTAVADVSTSSCGELTVPGEDVSDGTWTAVLRYESPTSRGESEPLEVELEVTR